MRTIKIPLCSVCVQGSASSNNRVFSELLFVGQWESVEKYESVVSCVLKVRSRVSEMVEAVKQNLMEGQKKQKEWYDKEARLREFEVGDTALVLLPTSASKLLAR